MEQRLLFVTKDNQGKPHIGFFDCKRNLWYVDPLNLYKSLFNNVTEEYFVDQVVMIDNECHLSSDMDVYIGSDGKSIYWLYFDGLTTVWSNEEEYEDKWKVFDNYQANVLDVLNEYYLAAEEFGIDKYRFTKDALEIIGAQFKLTNLIGCDPWKLGYADSSMQYEYYSDCLIHVERFDMSIERDVIKWSFENKGKTKRQISTSYIPFRPIDLTLIRRALEDFCLVGDTTFKIQSDGTRDIQATAIYLHNIKDNNLSKFGAITEVVVVPENYNHNFPVLYGFGYTWQVVKKLYDSFLSFLIWRDNNSLPLNSYNSFKSPIIGSFKTGNDVVSANHLNGVKYICCIAPDLNERVKQ